jgi:hypothetical protein
MSWLNLRETTKNIYFLVIVLAGVLMMYAASLDMGSIYGTNTYPVTYQVLDMVSASFALFMMVITTFYAGELVWREREARMGQMLDACPCRTGCPAVQTVRPDRPASAADAWSSCCAAWRSRSSRAIPLDPGLYLHRCSCADALLRADRRAGDLPAGDDQPALHRLLSR